MPKIFRLADMEAEEQAEPPAFNWENFSDGNPLMIRGQAKRRRHEKAEDPDWEEKQEASRQKRLAYQAKYRQTHKGENNA
jgi:hypothetical protein